MTRKQRTLNRYHVTAQIHTCQSRSSLWKLRSNLFLVHLFGNYTTFIDLKRNKFTSLIKKTMVSKIASIVVRQSTRLFSSTRLLRRGISSTPYRTAQEDESQQPVLPNVNPNHYNKNISISQYLYF